MVLIQVDTSAHSKFSIVNLNRRLARGDIESKSFPKAGRIQYSGEPLPDWWYVWRAGVVISGRREPDPLTTGW